MSLSCSESLLYNFMFDFLSCWFWSFWYASVMASSVAVAIVRACPFWEIVRAICVHAFIGCQWFAIASAAGSSCSSIVGVSSGVSGYAIRLIFTCFCWAVVFVLNVDVSYQYRTACVWFVSLYWKANHLAIIGGFCSICTSFRYSCVTSSWYLWVNGYVIRHTSHWWSDDFVEATSMVTYTVAFILFRGMYAYTNEASCFAVCSNVLSRYTNCSV